jgi:hypothetical protein
MRPTDLIGLTIHAVVETNGVTCIIGTTRADQQKVYLTKDIWEAGPVQSITALKKAFGYGRAPKLSNRPVQAAFDDPAPFVPTTVAEDEGIEPTFDMGPTRPWLDNVRGLAKAHDPEQVEGWDK